MSSFITPLPDPQQQKPQQDRQQIIIQQEVRKPRPDDDKWGRFSSSSHAPSTLPSPQLDALNAVQRLVNLNSVNEGTALPPVLSAGTRLESPTDFNIGYYEELEGAARFILNWATPSSMLAFQPRFRVYAYYGQGNVVWTTGQTLNTPDNFANPVIVANVDTSPADFFIENSRKQPIRFELEMRLGSGWVMVPEQRPCCTAQLAPVESYFKRITAAYSMTAKDRVIRGDASGGAFNLTLYDPTYFPYGWHCDIRNTGGANNITVGPYGAETIDGAASYAVTPGSQTFIYTDGTNWYR